MSRHRPVMVALALGLAVPGCYVGVGDLAADSEPGGSGDANDDDGDGDGDDEAQGSCAPEEIEQTLGVAYPHQRRMSRDELIRTYETLLPPAVFDRPTVAGRLQGLPPDELINASDFSNEPPVVLPGVLHQAARAAAPAALADAGWRSEYLSCPDAIDDACVQTFIERFGAKVWRRPLSGEEVADYLGFYAEAGGGEHGVEVLLRRLLQSPSLVFHLEEGQEQIEGRIRLTPYEVASRIAYMTSGGPPDDDLVALAVSGELDSMETVHAEVERLLDSPAGRERVDAFFRYYTKVSELPDPDPATAAQAGVDASGLGEEMRRETYEFVHAAFFEEGATFADLMTSPTAYPRTASLAAVYGTEIAGDEGPVVAEGHPGLLHRPSLLVSYGARTNPIVRGAHIRKLFLCGDLALPDPELVSEAKEELEGLDEIPNREAVEQITSGEQCIGCHALVNPLGFVFEGYDQLGARRTEEVLLDAAGEVVRTLPIDTRVEGVLGVLDEAVDLDDSAALAAVMAESELAQQCIAKRMLEYYRRDVTDTADRCALEQASLEAAESSLHAALVSLLANDNIFWRKVPQ